MLAVVLVFLFYTIVAFFLDRHIWVLLQRHRKLVNQGIRAAGTLVEMTTTMGALAISRPVAVYTYRTSDGREFKQREVLTHVVMMPIVGEPIDIVYLSESPEVCQIVGNGSKLGQLVIPGVIVNLLWLALLVSVFLEAFEP